MVRFSFEYRGRIGNSNAQFSNAFGTHIASGSEFEDDEVGWDLPLIQLENDLHPSSRYTINLANYTDILVRLTLVSHTPLQ